LKTKETEQGWGLMSSNYEDSVLGI